MSWRTAGPFIALRNVGRALHLNRLIAIARAGKTYEDRFQSAVIAAIRPGDTIWDVGANVGLYTLLFADAAGPSGAVLALEPSPTNLARLRAVASGRPSILVMPVALGDRHGIVEFEQGGDELGATSRVVEPEEQTSAARLKVPIERGDDLIASGTAPAPDVIKIDTEGFEQEVLLGLCDTLRSPTVRAVCVELHFDLLRRRNRSDAPAAIEKLLADCGFSIVWPDPSHIVGTRPARHA